jgi:hypothetical protein
MCHTHVTCIPTRCSPSDYPPSLTISHRPSPCSSFPSSGPPSQVALKLLLDKVMDEDACRGDSNGPFDAQTAKERREQLDREQVRASCRLPRGCLLAGLLGAVESTAMPCLAANVCFSRPAVPTPMHHRL